MTDPWLPAEFAQHLKWLSVLSLSSLLVVFPLQGRHRAAITSIWTAALVLGLLCLSLFVVALTAAQPRYLLAPLLTVGACMTLGFGGTFWPMRRAYRAAEMRKVVAQDI